MQAIGLMGMQRPSQCIAGMSLPSIQSASAGPASTPGHPRPLTPGHPMPPKPTYQLCLWLLPRVQQAVLQRLVKIHAHPCHQVHILRGQGSRRAGGQGSERMG